MLFAHLKRILRLGRVRLRGPRGAQDEFTLAAIAQNLRRLAKLTVAQPSRMRPTVKFAVICVSLLIAAHADAVDQRNQIKALDFQERGARLRLELERAYRDLRHTGDFKSAGNDVSSIVQKYIPVGMPFASAETTLRSSGFNIDPLPPREPPKTPSPRSSGEHKLMMRFAIFGTLVLAQQGVSRITVEITLLPKILGDDHNTVKGVHAAIYYRGV